MLFLIFFGKWDVGALTGTPLYVRLYVLYPMGGSKGTIGKHPSSSNRFNFMQFLRKNGQNKRLAAPPFGLVSPYPRLGNPGSTTVSTGDTEGRTRP